MKISLRFPGHIFICLFFLYVSAKLNAQSGSPIRVKKIAVISDTVQIDTLSLIPGTFSVIQSGHALDTSSYTVDYSNAKLIFKKHPPDSLRLTYKVFPYLFTESRKHKDIAILRPNSTGFVNPFAYTVPPSGNDLFKMEGLTKSGSISRGVNFGNNQDLSVNSSLNLQLAGKLSNDVDILLAASDQNIPIQPQGNTQNLQEFDKVFIQLSNKTSKLIAGDFLVTKPTGYFLNYSKKVQGIGFSTRLTTEPDLKDTAGQGYMRVSINAAVSKGKFGRQLIEGVEGNQGPYVLKGAENEPFIIILSGSEKVFIDGQLLKRGQEYDYIVDYNTAQVTFTSRNLITKDKRIVVEFQYSDKNYARSLLSFSDEYEKKNLHLHLNAYSEQDSKNQPLQQSLSDAQKQLLYRIGDTLSKAYSSAIDSVAWSNSLVLYRRPLLRDTTVSGFVYKDVFIYSNDPTISHFQLSFTNVGQGNGDYIQIPSSANGRVFQWQAPVGGIHQGSFAPVTRLVTPKKKQMVTFGGDYHFNKNTVLNAETALSTYDQNTFSPYNDQNNTGYAFKMNFANRTMWGKWTADTTSRMLGKHLGQPTDSLSLKVPLTGKDSVLQQKTVKPQTLAPLQPLLGDPAQNAKYIFTKSMNYEYTQQNFSSIERYKLVEFERDWNLSGLRGQSDQHIMGITLNLIKNKVGTIGYTLGGLIQGSQYSGLQHAANGLLNYKGFQLKADISLLNTGGAQSKSQFLRHKTEIARRMRYFTVGVAEQQEQNKQFKPMSDSLLATAFNYFEWLAYLQNADTLKNKYKLSYKQRRDFGVTQNSFNPLSYAQDMSFSMALMKTKAGDLRTNFTYRQLEVLNSVISSQKPENSLVGRIEYNIRLLRGTLTSGTFYEAGSGLEQKKEYSYVLVPAGQGQYTWIDYNNDGIKQLNEFEIAQFPDQATYIRVFTPTDQYIKAYTNQFTENLTIKPAVLWSGKSGWKKGLSMFSDQASYRIDRKTTDQKPEEAYNPFLKSVLDSSLVTLNSSFRNSFFFNQNDPVFGVDYNFQDIRGKSLLTTGFESRVNDFNELRIRWNLSKVFGLIADGKSGQKTNTSQFFAARNYVLPYLIGDGKFTIQPNTRFRLALDYIYTQKKNETEPGKESLQSHNLGAEMKYNTVGKGSLSAKLNFIQMNYSGAENSAVAYEMLDGLRAGKNATWGLSYQRTLSNNIQISISYEGRQSESTKTIHTGGASVRAFF